MKKDKLSLKGIKNVLSRDEMKKIMAGSGYSIPCYCDGVRKGFCLCDTTSECVYCCVLVCS